MNEQKPLKDIAPYRQPMVTSIGIMMGFLLNFLASWATADDTQSALNSLADFMVAGTLLVALVGMGLVLYRLLDLRHAPEKLEAIYISSFKMYMGSILLAFMGLGLALVL